MSSGLQSVARIGLILVGNYIAPGWGAAVGDVRGTPLPEPGPDNESLGEKPGDLPGPPHVDR